MERWELRIVLLVTPVATTGRQFLQRGEPPHLPRGDAKGERVAFPLGKGAGSPCPFPHQQVLTTPIAIGEFQTRRTHANKQPTER
ncbi:MAG: hypothetical protein KME30_30220 [Iphinoe sp. HA4291-MV1]|jgi:hypothetical protein|nr:hypothetical protein [Iphinoe sp. HA4291-MV1]